MEFRIAATFRKSLGKLSNNEQKEVKQAAFDLQLDPAHPSFNFHRVEQAQESNLWSARVGREIACWSQELSQDLTF